MWLSLSIRRRKPLQSVDLDIKGCWYHQRTAKGASGKGPRQKKSKLVKKCQNIFRHFSTSFRAGQKTSKIVKKCQTYFRHFSTVFARHPFSGPFGGSDIRPLGVDLSSGCYLALASIGWRNIGCLLLKLSRRGLAVKGESSGARDRSIADD